MPDMFGLEQSKPRVLDGKESAALAEVLKALRAHPAVAWCERMNSGAARIGGRFVRFGWPGCPDVLGQLHDGRLLGCEVKAPSGRLRDAQTVFLERIRAAGGVAFVARDWRDVWRELAERATGGSQKFDTAQNGNHPVPHAQIFPSEKRT